MKYFDWDNGKNEVLKRERDVGFEDVLTAIEAGDTLDILENSNKKKYPNQKVFVVRIEDYAFIVPFVEDEEKVFLKTIIPSRKATKKYLIKK
ncbi:MAG: DUF4258 domain-containing protein [Patescibacteria group bacterium]|nr:DUF4258 domain-containing protein [Patescibacteria group bacterium]